MSQMLERTSFDTPILPRLATIIAELQRGVYQIPEFQRPSVWEDDQRLELLDSIVKGLPIGSLLVWRSSTHDLKTYPKVAGITLPVSPGEGTKRTYLIDGHQRISTLFGALVRPGQPRTGIDARRWPIYYELGTSESPAFRLPPSRGSVQRSWLPLDLLLDNKALYRFRDALFRAGDEQLGDEVERVANVFKDYIIPVVPLVTDNLDLVTDAFVRINSKGSNMTEAHMLRALTYLKGSIDTDQGFRRIRKDLQPLGWGEVPDQALVNSLKAALGLDVYRSSVTAVNEELKQNPGALSSLAVALVEAVNLLRNFGVLGWGALPYAYQLVTLAALAYKDPGSLDRRRNTLKIWFWRTTYTEHFTGQTGGQIRRDIDRLFDTIPDQNPEVAAQAQVTELRQLRMGTVRTKAFLLFLASLPTDADARERRQQVLANQLSAQGRRALMKLVPNQPAVPGNIVVAELGELRGLREALQRGALTPEWADEYALPREYLNSAHRVEEQQSRRSAQLLKDEERFIQGFGLTLGAGPSQAGGSPSPEDLVSDLENEEA